MLDRCQELMDGGGTGSQLVQGKSDLESLLEIRRAFPIEAAVHGFHHRLRFHEFENEPYTKILLTHLDAWTPRQMGWAYQRRWPVERIKRAWKTDLGLGEPQVSTEEGRIEKSFGIAVLTYLLLIRVCHQEMLPGPSWSMAQLQHAFRLRMLTKQVEHKVKTRLAKARNVAASLALDQ